MSSTKIKLDRDLYERCKRHAESVGYSSVEEFVAHALEKEMRGEQKNTAEEQELVEERLRGLGYIE